MLGTAKCLGGVHRSLVFDANFMPQNLMDTMESMKKAVAVLESEARFFFGIFEIFFGGKLEVGGTRCWLVGVTLVPEKLGWENQPNNRGLYIYIHYKDSLLKVG